MSRFTFSRGNTQKVLALPLYALGAVASAIVPRRTGHWVFGCGSGVGEGALALYRETHARHPHLHLTWLARNSRDMTDASALGIPAVRVTSWRGFWLTLRAQVLVVTHGFGDANRFGTRGAFIVQLWHGIPLKLIHLDSPATMRSPILPNSSAIRGILRRMYRRAAQGISLFPAASELAASRIRTAFALPAERVVVTGDPRDDVLATGSPAERVSAARDRVATLTGLASLGDSPVLLYAPTWRDGERDPGVPTAEQWRALSQYLDSTGSTLIIRPHPLGVGDYAAGAALSPRIAILGGDLQGDITPLLPAATTLITDYSSIAYDFALTDGEIMYLAPDIAEYTRTRGLYEPYDEFSGGLHVSTWDEILALLSTREVDADLSSRIQEHTRMIASRNFAFNDGHNSARVLDEITARLSAAS
ncbi:CDP-glycerol glycerophosphotransferase family protein [Glaciihabitans sp. dw_435]|uniref:CDP-glycerol glycerophosphotransferase family protein n=1 Tax=Glaciihabitans sp. dw_435 TaxID=2720081 RepID=UPI001BD3087C|nr:CDP-glycerol glycerophosphotransferase family protein [Glaciihabitans sp. dw_435]